MSIPKNSGLFVRFILTASTIILCSLNSDGNAGIIRSLHEGWRFRSSAGKEWKPASVPGCVHTDLLANGDIDDPFYGDDEFAQRWIERGSWIYQTEFALEKSLLNREHIRLVFEGLDTRAVVTLNGQLLFKANNMFRTWEMECRDLLRSSGNILEVRFNPSVEWDSIQAARLPYRLPENRVFSRKAAYHYGWDWGPRFVTMGIWRPVYIEAWNSAKIENLQIYQHKVTDEKAECTALFEISSTDSQQVQLQIKAENVLGTGRADLDTSTRRSDLHKITNRLNPHSITSSEHADLVTARSNLHPVTARANLHPITSSEYTNLVTTRANLHPGLNRVEVCITINQPYLWWCNGLGKPNLYTVEGILDGESGALDSIKTRTGIRTLQVIQEKDSVGTSFFIRLNGVDVFMKGANYIPQDNFIYRVSREDYLKIIDSVVEGNMNMLRVWGGGIYENDCFYELCDENGILIWQDFMFACAMYPGDSLFMESVRQEAIENINRLRNHPCIALWCGNNEIDEAWKNWGWQQQYKWNSEVQQKIWGDYMSVFHKLLPELLRQYDPDRFYWPSSPSIGWGHDHAVTRGDMHYWGVWWGKEPFTMYEKKVGRFMSEFGFQGMPGLSTVKSFTQPRDLFIESKVMRAHQKHPFGQEAIELYMDRNYRKPKDFQSFLYVSQLLQAGGVRIALEAHRRNKPLCMGSLYWQLNDCWPGISWSSLDYYGRWKALHYTARRVFSDLVVLPTRVDGKVSIYINSDRLEPVPAKLELKLMDFSGEIISAQSRAVTIASDSSRIYIQLDEDKLLEEWDRTRLVLNMRLITDAKIADERNMYFVKPKDLDLPRTEITRMVRKNEEGFLVELSSPVMAKDVYLRAEGIDGRFSRNFFDLLPGEPVRVMFTTSDQASDFESKLEITSLVESYR